jgi:hypothetical protein
LICFVMFFPVLVFCTKKNQATLCRINSLRFKQAQKRMGVNN